MKKEALLLMILFLLAISCSPEKKVFPVGEYMPQTVGPSQTNIIRPPINRSPSAVIDIEEEKEDNIPELPRNFVPTLSTPIESYKLTLGYGIIGLNRTIGDYAQVFTKYDFKELLKSRNLRSHVDPIAASYEQFLEPLGGRVLFTGNEEDEVQDYLVYRDEEPIFEYSLKLSEGTFIDFIDEIIWFLGNQYKIKDVTKKDIILESIDSGTTIILGGGHTRIDDEILTNAESVMTGDTINFIAKAESGTGDDIFIPPEHSLREFLGEPTILTDKLDIRYIGIIDVPHNTYRFDNNGDDIELEINDRGRFINIPLVKATGNGFSLGDDEGILHIKEGSDDEDYKISKDDYLLLTASRSKSQALWDHQGEKDGIYSMIFQYKDIEVADQEIDLVSAEGTSLEAEYNGTPGDDAEGFLYFRGKRFKFTVGSEEDNYPLSFDLNGDGRMSGAIVDFMLSDSTIDFPSQEEFENSVNLSFTFYNFGSGSVKEERITIEILRDGDFMLKPHLDRERFSLENNDEMAVSEFGTRYIFLDEDDEIFEDIIIDHPLAERFAEIVIETR